MSYYDYAVLMHLKQAPWDPNPLRHESHLAGTRRRVVEPPRRARGPVSLLLVAAGLMVLGVAGIWV